MYSNGRNRGRASASVLLTEDSGAGLQLYQHLYEGTALRCESAGSNSGIFTWLQENHQEGVFVIEALPQEEVKPFAHVKEALAAAHRVADVVVVSSANPEAVRDEWKRFGLIGDVDLLCTQEMGSKAYCIGKLVEKGYDAILMCGDASGDEKAARKNHVLYYPILVGHEDESWRRFLDEALDRFTGGTFAGAYQQTLVDAFNANLGQ